MKSHLPFIVTGLTLLVTVIMTAVATAEPAGGAGIGPSFKGPLGLQLYSLRSQFKKDVPGTLDKVQKFGIKYAELATTYNVPPAEFKAQLLAHGIQPISGHFDYALLRDHIDKVIEEAEALGLQYVGCAWVPHTGDFTEETCHKTAEVFNKAGEALAKHNMKFFYHVHGYEFQPHGDGTLFDMLMAETKPEFVHYQMDIFWIVFPGQDPVKLMEKYPTRWELMHLKDMKKGLATGSLTGGTDVKNDVAIGSGQMDIPAILKEAKKIGIKYYFIEDESPISEEQIPESLKYLETVKF